MFKCKLQILLAGVYYKDDCAFDPVIFGDKFLTLSHGYVHGGGGWRGYVKPDTNQNIQF